MSQLHDQWIRKLSLVVLDGNDGINLSEFRIKFEIQNSDEESPNNAAIRVYNLSDQTIQKIRGQSVSAGQNSCARAEFTRVVLNAGYENGNFGVIFDGTIIQFKIGRENNRDTYLDILASDGDVGYNQGFVSMPLSKGSSAGDAIRESIKKMQAEGGYMPDLKTVNGETPDIRGKVLFGLAKAQLRYLARSLNCSWSIQNGQVQIVQLNSYVPGIAVEINRGTGLVGVPEKNETGLKLTCLLNPKIQIGQLIKLNNEEFNYIVQQNPLNATKYDQYGAFQYNAKFSNDGHYRVYVAEHSGDSRGNDWHTHIIALAVDISKGLTSGGVDNYRS